MRRCNRRLGIVGEWYITGRAFSDPLTWLEKNGFLVYKKFDTTKGQHKGESVVIVNVLRISQELKALEAENKEEKYANYVRRWPSTLVWDDVYFEPLDVVLNDVHFVKRD